MVPTFVSILTAILLATGNLQESPSGQITMSGEKENGRTERMISATVAIGTYTGIVPCADCEGIKMELTLRSGNNQGRTYQLKQTYLGKPARTNVLQSSGIWFVATGNKQNPKAVVLQLIPDGNYDPTYFLKVNDSQLKMLDRQQNEIKSKQNYTLKKQPK